MPRPHADPDRRSASTARRIAGIIGAVAFVAFPWSWFLVRDVWPTMDWVAVALPAIALGLTIAALAVAAAWSRPYASLAALSFLVFGIVAVTEPRTPQRFGAPERAFRLVAANVFQHNQSPRDAARTIVDAEGQVLVTVEAPEGAFEVLVQQLPGYEHAGDGEIGVFAAWPLGSAGSVPDVSRSNAMRVEVLRPGAPFVVYAMHLSNPLHETTFERQTEVVEALISSARREELPVVLAGDFNIGDRSRGYRRLHAAFRDAMRSGWASSTYDHGAWLALQLRIDHVFVGRGWCSAGPRTLPLPGSDHALLRVQLGACR